jgi:hypothetical protein
MTGPLDFPIVSHGDPEAAVVDILRDSAQVLEFISADNISTTLEGYNTSTSTQSWVMVTNEGGWRDKIKVYKPRIDIECYASSRSAAYDLVQACFSVMIASFGYRGNGLFICDVRSEMGPTRIYDKPTENFRYVCSLRLTVVPS